MIVEVLQTLEVNYLATGDNYRLPSGAMSHMHVQVIYPDWTVVSVYDQDLQWFFEGDPRPLTQTRTYTLRNTPGVSFDEFYDETVGSYGR